jgi:hypothetical protein
VREMGAVVSLRVRVAGWGKGSGGWVTVRCWKGGKDILILGVNGVWGAGRVGGAGWGLERGF